MSTKFAFDNSSKIVSVSKTGDSEAVNPEVPHKCPRCGSYFYGRFEGFDGNPYYCGNCGYTYPTITLEQLRAMHEKNGTLAKFDAGEMVESVGSFDIEVS